MIKRSISLSRQEQYVLSGNTFVNKKTAINKIDL